MVQCVVNYAAERLLCSVGSNPVVDNALINLVNDEVVSGGRMVIFLDNGMLINMGV